MLLDVILISVGWFIVFCSMEEIVDIGIFGDGSGLIYNKYINNFLVMCFFLCYYF